jgi:hypothetical protein
MVEEVDRLVMVEGLGEVTIWIIAKVLDTGDGMRTRCHILLIL